MAEVWEADAAFVLAYNRSNTRFIRYIIWTALLQNNNDDNYIIIIGNLRFAWDEKKAFANLRKHNVSFEEAISVFFDEYAMEYHDPDHSEDEDRFIMLGLSRKLHVLLVCHCYREGESVLRIISARKGDESESMSYFRRRSK